MDSHPSYNELDAYGTSDSDAHADLAVASHIAECKTCGDIVDKLRLVNVELQALRSSSVPASGCPESESWFRVAAGLPTDKSALELLGHAAECRSCAGLLEEARECLAQETLDTSGLKSSTEAWQKNVARLMAAQVTATKHRREPLYLRWALAGGFALIVTAAMLWLFNWRVWSPLSTTDRLLAETYHSNRTMEMRLPGAPHGDLRQRRGDLQSSRFSGLDSVPAFRRAVDIVARKLRRQPDDSAWLLRGARIDLLEWRYQPAFAALEQISSTVPDSYDLLSTRAIAEFERGEVEHKSEDFARAEDDLTKGLKLQPNDPALLFDRALVYERLMMYESAISDWQQVVNTEPDSGWRDEARQHLSTLQEKKNLIPFK